MILRPSPLLVAIACPRFARTAPATEEIGLDHPLVWLEDLLDRSPLHFTNYFFHNQTGTLAAPPSPQVAPPIAIAPVAAPATPTVHNRFIGGLVALIAIEKTANTINAMTSDPDSPKEFEA